MFRDGARVVIIGSGMGGGTLAWGLAQRGIDALIVERGEAIPLEPQNWSPQAVFVDRRYKPAEQWQDSAGRPFTPGVHYVVGGNSKVYGASLPRFRERDFERTVYPSGVSPAWPFRYADLEPYYCQAEALYRVHGAVGEDPTEPWRSRPFPFPAVPHDPYTATTVERLSAAGLHPSSTAMGIDVRPGGACLPCRTCDGFVCRVGAKSDAQTCAIEPALASGHVRLLTGTRIDRLELDGDRVVAAVGERGGEPVRIEGEAFVVSCGAANSAALLLRSRGERFRTGLGNDTGLVGTNYMVHNNTHIAAVDLGRRNDGIFTKTVAVHDFYDDLGDGYPGGAIQAIGKVQGVMMKTHARKVPRAVLDAMANFSSEWLVMSEDLPSRANRIVLDADGGIRVHWQRTNVDRHARLLAKARRMLGKIGYRAIFEQRFDVSMNSHMCGTAVAGHDPATSVVDQWCRIHATANCFVVDSSFFPSSAAQNPALTIAAQALRVSQEVQW